MPFWSAQSMCAEQPFTTFSSFPPFFIRFLPPNHTLLLLLLPTWLQPPGTSLQTPRNLGASQTQKPLPPWSKWSAPAPSFGRQTSSSWRLAPSTSSGCCAPGCPRCAAMCGRNTPDCLVEQKGEERCWSFDEANQTKKEQRGLLGWSRKSC